MIFDGDGSYRGDEKMSSEMKKAINEFIEVKDPLNDKQLELIMKSKLKTRSFAESISTPIFFNKYSDVVKREFKKLKPPGPRGTEWFSGKNLNDLTEIWNEKYRGSSTGGCHGKIFFECECGKYKLEREKRKYKGFNYVTRDFAIHPQSLTYFDINEELMDYNCFGCIINTDYYYGSGIHWVCIFIDATKEVITLEYFDSVGEPMLPEIKDFFKKIQKQCDRKCVIINVSNVCQQKDNHSCGAYTSYYIYSRLQGVPYKYFQEFEIKDHNMHKFRKSIFRE